MVEPSPERPVPEFPLVEVGITRRLKPDHRVVEMNLGIARQLLHQPARRFLAIQPVDQLKQSMMLRRAFRRLSERRGP